MATTQDLARAEAEFERADEALNNARSEVIRAERRLNLAREAGADVDPGLLAQATQNLDTAQRNLQAADAAYTAAQQNLQTVFDAVDDTAAPQADPVVVNTESAVAAQQPTSVPVTGIDIAPAPVSAADPEVQAIQTQVVSTNSQGVENFTATAQTDPGEIPGVTVGDRLQTDPGEVPGETVFGSSLATDTGVPTQTLAEPTPVAVPAVDPFEVDGADIGVTEDEFAGNGYGFVYDENGELVPADSVAAEEALAEPDPLDDGLSPYGEPDDAFEPVEVNAPEPVNENPWAGIDAEKAAAWEQLTPEDQRWLGDGDPTDEIILSRAPNGGQPRSAVDGVENIEPEAPVDYSVTFEDGFNWVIVDNATGSFVETGFATEAEAQARLAELTGDATGYQGETTPDDVAETGDADTDQASATQTAAAQARAQATREAQRGQAALGDWRVKLRLAEGADYLYRDPRINENGLLWPLTVTNGVVFPYTPTINTNYGANYSSYDLTHANYRGYFYQNSYVDEVTITATFTAQDTTEANYLLAVIHFFKSVTKMFYGQDANRGQPPPLVFLQGLGEFQFNLHPCVVRNFSYNLPADVDYIRARVVTIDGTNLLARRDRATTSSSPSWFSNLRLGSAGLNIGGLVAPLAPPTLGTTSPTYVPTKIEINLTLLPIQSRSQVSKQFSLKQYANGDLLKGGFW